MNIKIESPGNHLAGPLKDLPSGKYLRRWDRAIIVKAFSDSTEVVVITKEAIFIQSVEVGVLNTTYQLVEVTEIAVRLI